LGIAIPSTPFTDIRELQLYLNPEVEHYLDWFHITMRLTVMGQYAKGLDTTQERCQEILKSLESVKHYCGMGMWFEREDKLEGADLTLLEHVSPVEWDNPPKGRLYHGN
jgi:hypothetical protein